MPARLSRGPVRSSGGEPMKRNLQAIALACGLAMAAPALATITLYEHDNFQGRSITIEGPTPNLERQDFNDRASSAVIRGGEYLLCEDAGFHGRCVTLRS